MRKITKIKRSIRAISPVIATLLMIAIAVIASLVVYAWVTGYIGGTTTKASNGMLIQSVSHTANGYVVVYVQNVGQGTIQLRQTQSTYINSVLKGITESNPAISNGMVTFSPGTTASLTTDRPYAVNEKINIKITATDGTFAEYTTSGLSTAATGTFPGWPISSFTMSTSNPAVGQSVTFADTSTKGDGTINQWSWNFGDGQTSSVQNPSHSYATLGAKTVTLTVTDTNSRTATTTHSLTVGDYASPTASFTWTANNLAITFTDTSTAGSGTITSRAWNFGDSGTSNAQNPTHSYSTPGQKTVTLTVTDSNGKTSTTSQQVIAGNFVAPTAEFTISNSNPNVGETITFTDISTSSGTINIWSWNFGDSATSSVQNPVHSYTTPGVKTVTLTVTDSLSHTSTVSHTIDVNDYAAPIASFTFAPTTIAIGQTVTFTDGSTTGSGTISQWSWNFGSDASPATSTSQNPTASYSTAGQKTVTLTVTDSNSKTGTTSQTLTVNTPTPSGAVELIITTPASATAGVPFSATITARDESGILLTTYAGTLTFTSSDSQATLPAPSTLTSGAGTFTITLKTAGSETITVSDGTVTSTSGMITVNPTSATKLVYTAGTSQSITERGTTTGTRHISSVITVQMQDAFSNPVLATSTTSLALLSSSSGGRFYTDAQGNTQTSTVSITAGSSSADFYYSDNVVGSSTLTASYGTLTPATTTFTINAYQLVYNSGTPQTLPSGTMSGPIVIERQDYTTSHVTAGSTIITLTTSSSTGAFYTSQSGSPLSTPAQVTITAGNYQTTIYYKDSAQGTPILTASATSYTPAVTTFIITGPATKLQFTVGSGQSIFTGQVSSVITVTQQDSNGNAINAAATLTVSLSATSATGKFYSNAQGTGTAITQITIARGSSSASFYYKDTVAGSSTITASSTPLNSATTTFTIVLNTVSDGGFDQSGNNSPWHSSGSGYATNHETSDTAPNNWGAYAELETVSPGFTGTGYGALTYTFSPALSISSIPNTAGSISMQIYNTGYNGGELSGTGYYSFQIVLTASDGSQLIYWWGSNPATAPTTTSTVKVMNLGTVQGTFTAGQWVLFSRNLRADWTNAGLSGSASLASIMLQCNGYRTGNSQYGQELFIDNVAIQ
jgi:flagellin-like protein